MQLPNNLFNQGQNNFQNIMQNNFNFQNIMQNNFQNIILSNNVFNQGQISQNNIFMLSQNNIQNNSISQTNTNNKKAFTSIKQFNYVPMIGLENLGQTCYMNSVLQCFSNLYPLTNYFLSPSKQEFIKTNTITMSDPKAKSLSVAYKELIDNLWNGEPKTPFYPTEFKSILGELNPLFKGNDAGDSKDLACYIIMQLHQELNNIDSTLNKNVPNNFNDKDDIIVNPYNKNEVFQYFSKDFTLNNNSIISEIFYGVNQSMFECQVCKLNNMQRGLMEPLIKYNYENFFFLVFPLDEVRKFVAEKNNMGMYYYNINEVNLIDCFNYYQKQNDMNGYCEKCGSDNAKINTVTQVFSAPNILMLVLNRGKGLQFKIKINFPEYLDLTQTILNCNQMYELQSVVKHLGDNSASGHFISYCRSPVPKFNKCWFCYNDKTVVQSNNWKDIHDIGVTYILFYQLKIK